MTSGGFEITIKTAIFMWQYSSHGYGGIVRYCYVCFLLYYYTVAMSYSLRNNYKNL